MRIAAFLLSTVLRAGGWMVPNFMNANPTATQFVIQSQQDTPMMNTYLENQLDDFKLFAAEAGQDTLIEYLELAIDQQRTDFVEIILKELPKNWSADEMAENMVKQSSLHGLRYLLDYTTPAKHAEWLEIAVHNGDADLAAALYQKLPDADGRALAKQVYANIRAAKNRLSNARHIAVFEVFCPALTNEELNEYYNQAAKEKEVDFAEYLKQKIYRNLTFK